MNICYKKVPLGPLVEFPTSPNRSTDLRVCAALGSFSDQGGWETAEFAWQLKVYIDISLYYISYCLTYIYIYINNIYYIVCMYRLST